MFTRLRQDLKINQLRTRIDLAIKNQNWTYLKTIERELFHTIQDSPALWPDLIKTTQSLNSCGDDSKAVSLFSYFSIINLSFPPNPIYLKEIARGLLSEKEGITHEDIKLEIYSKLLMQHHLPEEIKSEITKKAVPLLQHLTPSQKNDETKALSLVSAPLSMDEQKIVFAYIKDEISKRNEQDSLNTLLAYASHVRQGSSLERELANTFTSKINAIETQKERSKYYNSAIAQSKNNSLLLDIALETNLNEYYKANDTNAQTKILIEMTIALQNSNKDTGPILEPLHKHFEANPLQEKFHIGTRNALLSHKDFNQLIAKAILNELKTIVRTRSEAIKQLHKAVLLSEPNEALNKEAFNQFTFIVGTLSDDDKKYTAFHNLYKEQAKNAPSHSLCLEQMILLAPNLSFKTEKRMAFEALAFETRRHTKNQEHVLKAIIKEAKQESDLHEKRLLFRLAGQHITRTGKALFDTLIGLKQSIAQLPTTEARQKAYLKEIEFFDCVLLQCEGLTRFLVKKYIREIKSAYPAERQIEIFKETALTFSGHNLRKRAAHALFQTIKKTQSRDEQRSTLMQWHGETQEMIQKNCISHNVYDFSHQIALQLCKLQKPSALDFLKMAARHARRLD